MNEQFLVFWLAVTVALLIIALGLLNIQSKRMSKLMAIAERAELREKEQTRKTAEYARYADQVVATNHEQLHLIVWLAAVGPLDAEQQKELDKRMGSLNFLQHTIPRTF